MPVKMAGHWLRIRPQNVSSSHCETAEKCPGSSSTCAVHSIGDARWRSGPYGTGDLDLPSRARVYRTHDLRGADGCMVAARKRS